MEDKSATFKQKSRSYVYGRLTRTFIFGEESLNYIAADNTGERDVTIPYETLDLQNRKIILTKNSRHRNRLYILLFIVCGAFYGGVSSSSHSPLNALLVMLPAFVVGMVLIFLRTGRDVKQTLYKSGQEQIGIFHDEQYDEIQRQLKEHWRAKLRKMYAQINSSKPIEQEIAKFEWLKTHDVISEQEFSDAVSTLRSLQERRGDLPLPEEKIIQ